MQSADFDERSTADALEIAADVPPTRPIPIHVELALPSAWENLKWEKRAPKIARFAEPTVHRFAALGYEASVDTLIGTVSATIAAKDVPPIRCWPDVAGLEVTKPYWSLVDRPWDTGAVGSNQCPIVDGACPDHCFEVLAAPYDPAAMCFQLPKDILLACSIDGVEISPVCVVRASDGETFEADLTLTESRRFFGFTDCDPDLPAATADYCD